MADNYLERRMEQYRAERPKAFRRGVKPTRAVFVCDGLSEQGRELVSRLSADPYCAVAFAGSSRAEGARLAQLTASRFYPLSEAMPLAAAIDLARTHYAPLPLEIATI